VILAVPEVHREVLVAQDRMAHLCRDPGQLLDRVGPDQLVLDRDERDRDAGHRADGRAPDPGADQDAIALDPAVVGLDRAHAAARRVEARDGDATFERDPLRLRTARQRGHDPHGLRDTVGRHQVGAEDRRGIQERDPPRGLLRGEELGVLDAVGARPAAAAMQLGHPLSGGGDLDPPDPVPGGLAVHLEVRVEPDRVLRDPAHRPRAVRLEHQARRVRRGTARLEQRTLIDHEDVARAELCQVVGSGGADDPGAHDHGFRTVSHQRVETSQRGCTRNESVARATTGRDRGGGGRSAAAPTRSGQDAG
jgi:hypothetical protein